MSIENYADKDLEPMFELFASYFTSDDRLLTSAYTRWFYAENPFGPALMVRVTEGTRWVGFMAMIPVELARCGKRLRTYYVVNVLVHPQFHGKHLFGRMITAAKALVTAEGAALMGHPNDMALKSWQRAHMHFHEPLRPSLALPVPWGRSVSASTVKEVGQLDASASVLTDIAAQSQSWCVAATPEYLDWRYLRHPSNTYGVQALAARGAPAGVQITKRVRPGVRLLVDQFVQAQQTRAAIGLLPPLTLCFWPESFTKEQAGAVLPLPWKKRIPFFLTRSPDPEESATVARFGLSASDF